MVGIQQQVCCVPFEEIMKHLNNKSSSSTPKGTLDMKANIKTERRDGQNLWRQSTMGLLLLTLLAVSPLQALGQGVIGWNSTGGVTLNDYFSSLPISTVTVNAGLHIDNTFSGDYAIYGYAKPWQLINNGALSGYYSGVYFDTGGSVNNTGTGSIYGYAGAGVYISGGAGFVTNSYSIYGHGIFGNGVELDGAGGVVNNLSGGTIAGDVNGVYLHHGGSVYNSRNGTILGNNNGVEILGGTGYVHNDGTISGGLNSSTESVSFAESVIQAPVVSSSGVYMNQGGSVDNGRHGIISGNDYGVAITGGGVNSVFNSGTIIGTNNAGVLLGVSGGSGVVVNQTGRRYRNDGGNDSETASAYEGNSQATISGGNNGVVIIAGPGYVTNSGSISGQRGNGVWLEDGGTVDNQRHGTISGNDYGVAITGGGSNAVFNSGTIIGTNNAGVLLGVSGGSGVVDNRRHGTISGGNNGVVIIAGPGSVYNDGDISGRGIPLTTSANSAESVIQGPSPVNGNGVYMNQGGSVYNGRHGTIEGYYSGVFITGIGGSNTVINSGTITGTNDTGVRLAGGGVVVNQTSQRHGGNDWGNDSETVSEYAGNNQAIISGNNYGVVITGGIGSVTNSGSITGTYRGVSLQGGGVVVNQTSRRSRNDGGNDSATISEYGGNNQATISGGYYNGVEIYGGTGYVYNNGKISGGLTPIITSASSAESVIQGSAISGVYLGAGGTVDNERHGTIEGYNNGVSIIGASITPNIGSVTPSVAPTTSYVINRGTITGDNGYGVWISGGTGVVDNYGTITGGNGTAIQLDSSPGNIVMLENRSHVYGNIVGGGNDRAFLYGHGEYGDGISGFSGFSTLDVYASSCRGGWNLTGTNWFSNNAIVDSGLLRVNGELDTPLVLVYEGATLGGAGVINGTVDNHGYLAPGNSPGNLTINGSYTNWNDYHAQVDSTGLSDHLQVNGTATINGGDVIAQLLDRKIYGSETIYDILTATNGVVGSYGTSYIEPQFYPYGALFLTSWLSNSVNDVYLILDRKKFTTVANTFNQNAVAGALDGIVDSPTPGMSNLVTEFFWLPSAGAARAALDSMSGEIHGTLGMLDVQQQDAFNNSIAQRTGRMSAGGQNGGYAASLKPVQLASAGSTLPPMQKAETNPLLDIWLQGFGSFGHVGDDGNALGGNYTISGLSGGLDYRLTPKLLVGLGMGYSQDNADVGGSGANGKVNAFQLAGYGGYVNGPWHLDGILSYGFLHTDTTRFIDVGSISQQADGSYDGGILSLSAEGGYAFEFGWLTVEPTIGLNYAHLWQDSFSETGTATDGHNYGLNVNSVDMDSFRSAVGVRLAAQFGKKTGVQFIPALRAVWKHEFMDRYADVNASFVGGSGDFIVRGVELGADTAVLGGGLTVAFNKAIQGFVNYDANLNSKLTSSTVSGGLSYSW